MDDNPQTYPEVLRRGAEKWPENEAISDGDVSLTFAELYADATVVARALRAHGVGFGDRVAIWAPNSHWWVRFSEGVHLAGAVVVPINTRYRAYEARELLNRTGAKVALVDEGFLGFSYLSALQRELADADRIDELELIVDVASSGGVSVDPGVMVSGWDEFCAAAEKVTTQEIADLAASIGPDTLGDILFTSGTTGQAKGVRISQGAAVQLYRTFGELWGLRQGDRHVVSLPMFHAGGNKAGVLNCLLHGATIIPMAVFDPIEMMSLIEKEHATALNGPPTVMYALLDNPRRSEFDLSTLRLAATGAAVVPVAMVERVHAELPFEHFITAYGMTECYGTATMCRRGDSPEIIANTNGQSLPGIDLRVVGLDGQELAPGEQGEVLVRGANVTPGYWDTPDQTAESIREGWLHTGDIGQLDEKGYLKITDRLKDMFFVGGFNVSPAEIEQALARHPEVAEVSVIGVPDERLGEVARAYVIAKRGTSPTAEQIIAWCRERLANFKVPRSVVVVEDFPRSAQGKVLKRELREFA